MSLCNHGKYKGRCLECIAEMLSDPGVSPPTGDGLLDAIKHLAKLLKVEDHEVLECIERRLISEEDTKPLWILLKS